MTGGAGWLLAVMLFSTTAPAGEEAPLAGGETTVHTRSREAFSQPAANLPAEDLRRFAFGNRLFETNWVIAPASVESLDGLGPLYNRVSCSGCHVRDGRGRPPISRDEPVKSMLVRIFYPGEEMAGVPDPRYGHQIQDRAIPGIAPEARVVIRYGERKVRLGDGTVHRLRVPRVKLKGKAYGSPGKGARLSALVAPAMPGLGLLEAVSEETILSLEDPEDRDGDGVSGRANRLDGGAIGRFGWKASVPDLERQTARALSRDMGITSSVFPEENVAAEQVLGEFAVGGSPEIRDAHLAKLVFYTQTLAVPARRRRDDPRVRRGEQLFREIGCATCHLETLKTAEHPQVPALSGQTIHPYTDLLLHDMGPELADGRVEHQATGSEWRTPPLWGIGLVGVVNDHTFFLHDGRARNLLEAVLWHGGEAEGSRERFGELIPQDREAVLAFLESL